MKGPKTTRLKHGCPVCAGDVIVHWPATHAPATDMEIECRGNTRCPQSYTGYEWHIIVRDAGNAALERLAQAELASAEAAQAEEAEQPETFDPVADGWVSRDGRP